MCLCSASAPCPRLPPADLPAVFNKADGAPVFTLLGDPDIGFAYTTLIEAALALYFNWKFCSGSEEIEYCTHTFAPSSCG